MSEHMLSAQRAEHVSGLRTESMGLAILAIGLYHVDPACAPRWLLPLRELGQLGVDAFFYLSGFGLMCSRLRRPRSYGAFMLRRLRRILPAYLPVCAAMLALQALCAARPSALEVAGSLALLDYLLLRDPQFWFVSSILLCYALFPPYADMLSAAGSPARLTAGAIAGCLALGAALWSVPAANHLLVFIFRLPAFLLGIHAGWAMSRPAAQLPAKPGLCAIAGLAVFLLLRQALPESAFWRLGLWWLPFALAAPAVCRLLAATAGLLRRAAPLGRLLRHCGRHSYEIYLLHVALFDALAGTRPLAPLAAWLGLPAAAGFPWHMGLLALAVWLAPALSAMAAAVLEQPMTDPCPAG